MGSHTAAVDCWEGSVPIGPAKTGGDWWEALGLCQETSRAEGGDAEIQSGQSPTWQNLRRPIGQKGDETGWETYTYPFAHVDSLTIRGWQNLVRAARRSLWLWDPRVGVSKFHGRSLTGCLCCPVSPRELSTPNSRPLTQMMSQMRKSPATLSRRNLGRRAMCMWWL